MTTFPTIECEGFPIATQTEDPAIRTPFENGSEQTRARFTRLRRTWTLKWNAMTNAQHDTLLTFWGTVNGGTTAFDWTNPYDDATYEVRFNSPIKETWINPDHWAIEVEIKEI